MSTIFKVGDQVRKISGYRFDSEIRSVFTKANGDVRVVAENGDGLLHIFNEGQLESTERKGLAGEGETFQARVQPWMMECSGPEIAGDITERCDRFIEEAFELLQSLGYDPARIITFRDLLRRMEEE